MNQQQEGRGLDRCPYPAGSQEALAYWAAAEDIYCTWVEHILERGALARTLALDAGVAGRKRGDRDAEDDLSDALLWCWLDKGRVMDMEVEQQFSNWLRSTASSFSRYTEANRWRRGDWGAVSLDAPSSKSEDRRPALTPGTPWAPPSQKQSGADMFDLGLARMAGTLGGDLLTLSRHTGNSLDAMAEHIERGYLFPREALRLAALVLLADHPWPDTNRTLLGRTRICTVARLTLSLGERDGKRNARMAAHLGTTDNMVTRYLAQQREILDRLCPPLARVA